MGALVSAPACAARADLNASARASVWQALYAASATTAAAELVADARMAQQRRQIDALQRQLKAVAGRDMAARARMQALERQLAQAQERYVQQLADADRAYGQAIMVLREAVQDIAATPAGEAALRQFNAGEAVQALNVLDRLVASRERARRVRADLETAAERRRVAMLALEARAKGSVQTRDVIARYEEVTRLDPGLHWDWVELGRLYEDAGLSLQAAAAAEQALQTARTDFDRATALSELGMALFRRHDLAGARLRYQASLDLLRRLSAADPDSGVLRRSVSVALARLAEVQEAEGDLPAARAGREQSLQAVRQVLAAHRNSVTLQRDLSGALANLGSALRRQGDDAGALDRYRESLDIARQVLAAHPTRVDLSRDVGMGCVLLGDMLLQAKDAPGARLLYQESLDIAQRQSAADPGSASLRADIGRSLSRLGDAAQMQRDAAGARRYFERSLDVATRLMAADPTSADDARRVYLAQLRLGDVMLAEGDVATARSLYQDSLDIARRLSAATQSPENFSDVGASLSRLGDVLAKQGDARGANALYTDGLANVRRAVAAAPASAVLQRQLWLALWKLAETTGSGLTWPQVVEAMEDMQQRALLDAEAAGFLDQARARARQAAAR